VRGRWRSLRVEELGSSVPVPRRVFAIGLNYSEHAAESGSAAPTADPPVFTKFPSCITGTLQRHRASGLTDTWTGRSELVAVIGRRGFRVSEADALRHVAGYAVGQHLSERILRMAATPPQFSRGKSLPGFGPIGPWLVILDEVPDTNALELGCEINGEVLQAGHTSQLIVSVPKLIETLSATTPLLFGDVIFTGTPAGVGIGRNSPRFLADGDVLTTHIEGLGRFGTDL